MSGHELRISTGMRSQVASRAAVRMTTPTFDLSLTSSEILLMKQAVDFWQSKLSANKRKFQDYKADKYDELEAFKRKLNQKLEEIVRG